MNMQCCDTPQHITYGLNCTDLNIISGDDSISVNRIADCLFDIRTNIITMPFTLFTEDTSSLELLGNGKQLHPLKGNVLISGEDGNILSILDDGLFAPESSSFSLRVREVDSSPNVLGVTTIVFPNTSVTDNGSGQVTITFPGAGSTPNLQQVTDVGETCDNNIILESSPALNTVPANGRHFVSGNNNTLTSSTNSIVAGTFNTVSGIRNGVVGLFNSVSGGNGFTCGNGNTVTELYSITGGNSNSNRIPSSFVCGSTNSTTSTGFEIALTLVGISNSNGPLARGALAAGGANYINNDFAIALGHANKSEAKGSIAMGAFAKTSSRGEIAFASGAPNYFGHAAIPAGDCQTSIFTYHNYDTSVGNAKSLSMNECKDGAGNDQYCGQDFGKMFYTVPDDTVLYITARFLGITATNDITAWTLDTWVKNNNGTATAGTTAFTPVQKDASYVDMDAVSISFSTDTGNNKYLNCSYNNTGTYPVSMYSCTFTVNKLKFS